MHAIIFDAGNIPYIDASATQELLEMVVYLNKILLFFVF